MTATGTEENKTLEMTGDSTTVEMSTDELEEVHADDTMPVEPLPVIACPKCSTEMEKVTFQTIEIDRCPECQGIWFDLHEHEDLRALPGSEQIDVGADSAVVTEDSRSLNCPRCRTRMYTTRDPEQTHLVFEKCSVCYGVFFDAGEFADFKNVTFIEKLKALFV